MEPALTRPGLSAGALKGIALAAMLIDHTAWAFVPTLSVQGMAMHVVGRITGPVMFYFIAEGYHHTRSANRYTLRLFLFALLSWQPFAWFQTGQVLPQGAAALRLNVIYTLLLGLLALRARHELKNPLLRVGAILALAALSYYGDWQYIAVGLILIFDALRGNFKRQAAAYCCVVGFLAGLPALEACWQLLNGAQLAAVYLALAQAIMTCGMFLPIVLLRFYNGARGGGGRLAALGFYVFYPAHLLILNVIKYLL